MKIEFSVKDIFSKGVDGLFSECNTIHELAECDMYISENIVKTIYGISWSCGRELVSPKNSGMTKKDFWISLYVLFVKPEMGKKILKVEMRKDETCYLLSFDDGYHIYYVFLNYSDGHWRSNCSVDSRPAYAFRDTVYLYNVQYFPLYHNNEEYLRFRGVYDNQSSEFIQQVNIENM